MVANINKDKYIVLCQSDDSVPLYSQPFWLNAVCGEDHWDVLLYEKGNRIVAAMPYYTKKRFSLPYITQPMFTQTNGIWISYPDKQSHEKKLSFEKEVITVLIGKLEQLPICFFQQCFHHSFTNWLPFYWHGYSQTTKYTYRIEDISCVDAVFAAFSHAKRKNIRKSDASGIALKVDLTSSEFYDNHSMTLAKQGQEIGYSFELFQRMYNAARSHSAGRIFAAVDNKGHIHAAHFIVWDSHCAYDLISTIDPDFRNSGASSWLILEVIKSLSGKVSSFDFEGSMIESVENSFRQFGATQTPYFCIRKIFTKNPLARYAINRKLGEIE